MPVTTPDIKVAQKEAVMRSITNRREAGASATGEAKLGSRGAAEYWKKKQAETGERGMLKAWEAGETAPVEVPDQAKAQGVIRENVSDMAVRGDLMTAERAIRTLISGDARALETASQPEIDALVKPIQKALAEVPEMKVILDEINASPNPNAEWIKFLTQLDEGRKPGENSFTNAVRTKFAGVINKERGGDETISAEGNVKKLQAKIDANKAALKKNGTEQAENLAKQDSYREPTGEMAQKLANKNQQIEDDSANYEEAKELLSRLETEEQAAFTQFNLYPEGGSDRQQMGGILDQIRRDKQPHINKIKVHEKMVSDRDEMIAERDGLPDKYTQLVDQNTALLVDQHHLASDKAAADLTLRELGASSGAEAFKKEFQGIVGDAFKETMVARAAAEGEGITATFDELIAKETDVHVKAALTNLRDSVNRWSHWEKKFGLKGRKDSKEFDKDAAREDLQVLISGGPEAFNRKFLARRINPDKLSEEERKIYMERGEQALFDRHPFAKTSPASADAQWWQDALYTSDEINALITNKEYMDKVSPKAIGLLIRQSHQNGLVSEAMAEQLADTEWGKDALEEAIKLDKTTKEHVEKTEKNLGSRIVDWAKKHKKLSILMMLLIPGGMWVGGGYLAVKGIKNIGFGAAQAHG